MCACAECCDYCVQLHLRLQSSLFKSVYQEYQEKLCFRHRVYNSVVLLLITKLQSVFNNLYITVGFYFDWFRVKRRQLNALLKIEYSSNTQSFFMACKRDIKQPKLSFPKCSCKVGLLFCQLFFAPTSFLIQLSFYFDQRTTRI